jgi:hypothetical protein
VEPFVVEHVAGVPFVEGRVAEVLSAEVLSAEVLSAEEHDLQYAVFFEQLQPGFSVVC